MNLKEKFDIYHANNPHVYTLFEKFAKEAAQYRKRYSADAVAHRIRWETMISTEGDDFKLSNSWVAFYARLFMKKNPEYDGFFQVKQQRYSQ